MDQDLNGIIMENSFGIAILKNIEIAFAWFWTLGCGNI